MAGEQVEITPGSGFAVMTDVRSDPSIGAGASAGVQGIFVYDGLVNSTAKWFTGLPTAVGTAILAQDTTRALADLNASRRQLWVQNDADTYMYVRLGPSAGANLWNAKIAPNQDWTLPTDAGCYTGLLTCSWAAGVNTALFAQVTQVNA